MSDKGQDNRQQQKPTFRIATAIHHEIASFLLAPLQTLELSIMVFRIIYN